MSTLITDTLKMKGDGNLPVAFAKDVHVDYDNTDLETALAPATDEKLGRVKIGNNMDIDTDGTLSIVNRVAIDDEPPTDGTYVWINNTVESTIDADKDENDIARVSQESYNALSLQDDGFYDSFYHTIRPEPQWHYYLDGVQYCRGWAVGLTNTINYYVSATGDDVYGDGTAANPRQTLSGLPRLLNGYTINIYISGDYKSIGKNFNIGGFIGGNLMIYMVGKPIFQRLQIYNCAARVYIYDAFVCDISNISTATLTGWTQSLYIGGAQCVEFRSSNTSANKVTKIQCIGKGKAAYTATTGATCHFRGCLIELNSAVYINQYIEFECSNAYQGISIIGTDHVNIRFPTAKNNQYGIIVGFGKMGCDTIKYSGNNTNTNIYHGGRLLTGGQSSVGKY